MKFASKYEKYGIDKTKLSIDYTSHILKPKDKMPYSDIYYLYITLNLTLLEIADFLNISIASFRNKLSKTDIIKSPALQEINRKRLNLKRYGVTNTTKLQSVKEKMKNTNLERFGTVAPAQNEKILQKIKNTNLKLYGTEWNWQTEVGILQRKLSNILKWGVDNPMKCVEVRKKGDETKRKNGTFVVSKLEIEIQHLLENKYNVVKTQYKSEKYPFSCDFYIPAQDLYIEIQGHWSHGKEYGPYDETNKLHQMIYLEWQEKAKTSKAYKSALDVWTIRDPLKRKVASENNLNWLEFFNILDFKTWLNNL